MDFPDEIIQNLTPTQIRIGFEIALSIFGSLSLAAVAFVIKFFGGMNTKLDLMLTNHLPHIEQYTGKSAEALEKLVETQKDANIQAVKLNEFIRTKMD